MRIFYSPYELIFKKPLNGYLKREGALLKVQFCDSIVGFSDCHPWVEFSDQPLKKQLELLKKGITTRLTNRSLHFAKLDGEARLKAQSLLKELSIPISNYLIADVKKSLGEIEKGLEEDFKTFKIKISHNFEEDLLLLKKHIPKNCSLRIDLNLKFSKNIFLKILKCIKQHHIGIEYIEDPFLFDEYEWSKIQKDEAISFAADAEHLLAINKEHAAKVIILKPAIVEPLYLEQQKTVITSYLDHPFGQVTAAFIASKFPDMTAGLLTHHLYQKNPYSEQLTTRGAHFRIPEGFGFGFDDLLAKEKWRPLS